VRAWPRHSFATPNPTAAARLNCSPPARTAALAHGFSIDLMVDPIDAGLATAKVERVVVAVHLAFWITAPIEIGDADRHTVQLPDRVTFYLL
jgi:hypothetical protein